MHVLWLGGIICPCMCSLWVEVRSHAYSVMAIGLLCASLPKSWISLSMVYCSFANLGFHYVLILRATRVMVWCLWWCCYMPHVPTYVNVHFLLSCWCSQDVRRLKCDSCALWGWLNGGMDHFFPLVPPG